MFDYENEEEQETSNLLKIKEIIRNKLNWGILLLGLTFGFSICFLFFRVSAGEDSAVSISAGDDSVQSTGKIIVDLSGAVAKPGVYELDEGSRVADLLKLGEGFLGDASAQWVSKKLNLSTKLKDSQKVYIPFEWELALTTAAVVEIPDTVVNDATSVPEAGETVNDDEDPSTDNTDNSEKINVNEASQLELESLPGIGKVYAQRIIENRPYADLDELAEKAQIPTSTIEKIREFTII